MLKRILVIALLCFSMMLFLQAQALAWTIKFPAGWGTGSYHGTFIVAGGQKPGTETTFFSTGAEILQASLVCVNPGTNQRDVRGGKGGITIVDLSPLGDQQESYDERGKYVITTTPLCSKATLPNYTGECEAVDFSLLWDVYNTDCRNSNWAPYEYLIQNLNLSGTILTDCDIADPLNPTNCATSANRIFYCETKADTKTPWVTGPNACDPSIDSNCTCDDSTPQMCTNVSYVCVDKGSPIAWDDNYSVRAGRTLKVSSPGVLSNDHDTGDPSTITPLTVGSVGPVYDGDGFLLYQEFSVGGSLEFYTKSGGKVTINANGSFTVTGLNSSDLFTYKAKDGNNNLSNSATVTIKVTQ